MILNLFQKLQIECNRFDASGNSVITTSSLLDNQFQIKNKNFNDSNQYRNHSIQLTNYSSPSLSKFTIDSEKIMTNHNDPNENSDDEDAQKHSTATNKEQIESDQIDFDGTKRLNQSIESIILMDEKFVPKSIANQTDCNLGNWNNLYRGKEKQRKKTNLTFFSSHSLSLHSN